MLIPVIMFDLPEWKKLSSSSKAVLPYMIARADAYGICWPSLVKIAEDESRDRKTIISVIAELESVGFLKSIKTPGRVNRYQVIPIPNSPPVTKTPVVKTGLSSMRNGTSPVPNGAHEQINDQIKKQNNASFSLEADKRLDEINKKYQAGQDIGRYDYCCLLPDQKIHYEKRGDVFVKKPDATLIERTL